MTDAVQTANPTDAREASKSRVTTQETILAKLPQRAASEPDPEKDEHDKDGESKPKRSAQERIQELASKRREAEAKAEEAERRVRELESRLAAQSANAKPLEAGDRPLRTQFATEDEYIESLADWKARQALAKREQEQEQARVEAEEAEIAAQWNKRQEKAMKALPDYADVIGASEVQVSNVVHRALLESDMGPEVAYYLALHPAEAKRLNQMRPVQAIKRIDQIERDLADIEKDDPEPEPEKEKPKVPTKSKAPPPIEPVKSVPSSTGSSSSDYEEYKRRRQAEQRK